jgi:hypothetical protein
MVQGVAAAGITIIKKFSYRGDPNEEWSNTYHLTAAPADKAAWVSLLLALGGMESNCYSAGSTVIRALCYDDTDNPATYTLSAPGDFTAFTGGAPSTSGNNFAGDQAATVGWNTGNVGSTGKAIWLRKYFHDGWESSSDPDSLSTSYASLLATFAGDLLTTAIDGSIFFADKTGARPDGPARVDPYSTTRTLKRRGKRP